MFFRVPITEEVRSPVIEQADENTQRTAETELYFKDANMLCGSIMKMKRNVAKPGGNIMKQRTVAKLTNVSHPEVQSMKTGSDDRNNNPRSQWLLMKDKGGDCRGRPLMT